MPNYACRLLIHLAGSLWQMLKSKRKSRTEASRHDHERCGTMSCGWSVWLLLRGNFRLIDHEIRARYVYIDLEMHCLKDLSRSSEGLEQIRLPYVRMPPSIFIAVVFFFVFFLDSGRYVSA